ncbi:RNA polymerase sigma factor [bacterium]|nr:RNA polymerase sigma factor [bacterium]
MKKLKPKKNIINEHDLVARLKKGEQWAFNTLVDLHQARLLKIAYGITFDTQESLEIVQDVFVIVFKKINNFRQDSTLSTWLRKITVNQCLNWKRKWKRRFKWSHDSLESENDNNLFKENLKNRDPEMQYQGKQLGENIMKAMQKLPEKTRIVFVLNSLEGLSYEQIAKTLNIKKGTVSSRMYFARKNLMTLLETEN